MNRPLRRGDVVDLDLVVTESANPHLSFRGHWQLDEWEINRTADQVDVGVMNYLPVTQNFRSDLLLRFSAVPSDQVERTHELISATDSPASALARGVLAHPDDPARVMALMDACQEWLRQAPASSIYVVGSWESGRFIADRVYLNRADAIEYCESRMNNGVRWGVMRTKDGASWIQWEAIFLPPSA